MKHLIVFLCCTIIIPTYVFADQRSENAEHNMLLLSIGICKKYQAAINSWQQSGIEELSSKVESLEMLKATCFKLVSEVRLLSLKPFVSNSTYKVIKIAKKQSAISENLLGELALNAITVQAINLKQPVHQAAQYTKLLSESLEKFEASNGELPKDFDQ